MKVLTLMIDWKTCFVKPAKKLGSLMSWHYITFKVVRSLFCLNFTIRSLAVVLLCTLEQQEHKTEKYNNMNEMNHVPPSTHNSLCSVLSAIHGCIFCGMGCIILQGAQRRTSKKQYHGKLSKATIPPKYFWYSTL